MPIAENESPLLTRNPPGSALRRPFKGWALELSYEGEGIATFPTIMAAIKYARSLDHARGIKPARAWYVKHSSPTHYVTAECDSGDSHLTWIRSEPLDPASAVERLYKRYPYMRARDQEQA